MWLPIEEDLLLDIINRCNVESCSLYPFNTDMPMELIRSIQDGHIDGAAYRMMKTRGWRCILDDEHKRMALLID